MPISTHEFILALFEHAELGVYFSSLPNTKDDPKQRGEKRLLTRNLDEIEEFVARWDIAGRGLFFCVSTIVGTRKKDNAREILGLHMDADYRTIVETPTQIDLAIAAQRCQPTALVRSGHGKHGYWLFNQPLDAQQDMARIEAAMRQLADLFAGDLAVCEVSRLMRLPGTHNSKNGDWLEVEAEHINGPRYELDDLEEWLSETAPVLRRTAGIAQPATANAGPVDPFLAAAERMGFKPPVDVEARLAAMTYGGAGDSSIHSTQLSVSASLLNAGMDMEEVVGILMETTRMAAGHLAANWNWGREENAIRKLCRTWVGKHPQPPPGEVPEDGPDDELSLAPGQTSLTNKVYDTPADVIDLAAARKRKGKGKKVKETPLHVILGQSLIDGWAERGEHLMFTDDAAYRYSEGLWRLEIPKALEPWLDRQIELACLSLSLTSTARIVNETRKWLVRNPALYRPAAVWDRHGMVPTESGLVDPRTGDVHAMAPEHYCTWRIPYPYDPFLHQPPLWLQMLNDMLADRPDDVRRQYVELIQEVLGAGLIDTKGKGLSKALVLWGAQDSGKSGALEVMAGLFGADVNATPLGALAGDHGLMGFQKRRPWVLHEAFDQAVWHLSATVKAIISGDAININIKSGPFLTTRMVAPVLWATNHAPQFRDASKAVVERMVIVPCRQAFDQDNPVGVALEAARQGYSGPAQLVLATEMPWVLAWAVDGLVRCLKRGSFVLPEEAKQVRHEVRLDSNIVAGFVEDCCDYDPDGMVSTADFAAGFTSWWAEHKGEDRATPSGDRIAKALRALGDMRICTDRIDMRDNTRRYYGGLSLNEEGRRHWREAVVSDAFIFQGRKASTTSADGNPNRIIPREWKVTREGVRSMMAGHSRHEKAVTSDRPAEAVTERSPDGSPTQPIEPLGKPRF